MKPIDNVISRIAEFTISYKPSIKSLGIVKLAIKDAFTLALMAGDYKNARKIAMPLFDGNGLFPMLHSDSKTNHISGTYQLGTLISWANYNDVYLNGIKVHPSECISSIVYAILAGDTLRLSMSKISTKIFVEAVAKAYAISMKLSTELKSENEYIDGTFLIKVSTAAVNAWILGGTIDQIESSISHAFADLMPLRLYKRTHHMTNRNIWAGADAGSRGLLHAVNAVYREEATLENIISDKDYGLNSLGLEFKNDIFKIDNPDKLIETLDFKIDFGCAIESHGILEKIQELKEKLNFSSIKSIIIYGQPLHKALFHHDHLVPLSARLHNLGILISMLILYGRVNIDFTEDSFINSPEFKKLNELIVYKDLKINKPDYNLSAKLEIYDIDDNVYQYDIGYHKGHHSFSEKRVNLLDSKWNKCLSIGCQSKNIDEIATLLNMNEELDFVLWFQNLCKLSSRHRLEYDKV